jgi:hypothetical protein
LIIDLDIYRLASWCHSKGINERTD